MPTWVYVDTPRAHVDSLTAPDVHVAIQGRLSELSEPLPLDVDI